MTADRTGVWCQLAVPRLRDAERYGDIVPVNQWARSLAVVEALMGQIFLVTLVAALVGNLGRERPRPSDDTDRPPDETIDQ